MRDIESNGFTGAAKRVLILIFAAAGALYISLLPYIVRGNYFVLYDDGVRQHVTFLEYMFGKNIFGGVGGYDYNIGLGGDYAVSFSYYMLFDPITLLLFILPRGNIMLSYSILVVIKFILTAVFMYVYLRSRKVKFTLSVVFSIAYMLGGYIIYTYVRHPDLAAGAMYVPLVTLGLEKAIDRKRPFALIISVFVMTISSFYLAFMVTVYAIGYAALYYFYKQKDGGNKVTAKGFFAVFFRTAAFYLLGLLLAFFLLMPVSYGYFTASRNAGKGLALYNFGEIVSIASSFILPIAGAKYSAIMFSPFAVLLALAALSAPKHRPHKIMSVILTACVFLPFVGYALNMFNYANNRFTFLLSFSVFAMTALHLNDKTDRSLNSANYMIKGGAVIIAVTANTGLLSIPELLPNLNTGAKVGIYIAAIAVLALSAFLLSKLFKKNFRTIKLAKLYNVKYLVVCFIVITIAAAATFNVTYSELYDDGTYYAKLNTVAEQTASELMRDDNEFTRLDCVTHGYWGDSQNRPLNNDYHGTMIYNTMASGTVGDFVASNTIVSFSSNLGMAGVNGRSALQALLAAKYYRTDGNEYVPRQYKATDVKNLYVTDKYIAFGTVFDKTMSEEKYNALSAVERQYAMLGAVVKADGEKIEYTQTAKQVKVDLPSNFTLTAGQSKTIEINQADSELYVGFSLDEVSVQTGFSVKCGKTAISQFICKKGEQMYTGQYDFLFKLDENGKSIKISNSYGGPLKFKNFTVYASDYQTVINMIDQAAQQPHMTETEFNQNGFNGTINSDGGTMLIPLSYSRGWTAYVDGKQTEISKADISFMSIDVPSGTHKVEFKYATPLYDIGMTVSAVAAAAAVVLVIVYAIIDIKRKSLILN